MWFFHQHLEMIFKQCTETGVFPSEWKKTNIVPIHKKGDRQTLENYRPVSLLPICGKFLKKLMYNEMFNFFIENKLISSNQSGFKQDHEVIFSRKAKEIYHPPLVFNNTSVSQSSSQVNI